MLAVFFILGRDSYFVLRFAFGKVYSVYAKYVGWIQEVGEESFGVGGIFNDSHLFLEVLVEEARGGTANEGLHISFSHHDDDDFGDFYGMLEREGRGDFAFGAKLEEDAANFKIKPAELPRPEPLIAQWAEDIAFKIHFADRQLHGIYFLSTISIVEEFISSPPSLRLSFSVPILMF